ncbi:S26 family signal peptidase [Candidatus Pacearchaeota archaeon]|nr:S26 family signal peptidase [Candidatus Pacearchaeota archaeon]
MNGFKKFWNFLKQDTWSSWIVSFALIIVFIKFIFFPVLSFATGTSLPLVVVESCSMYHESGFEDWWSRNAAWYESKGIDKTAFESFTLKNGLNKGDIVFVWGRTSYKQGDIIIFNAGTQYPLIHRIVSESPLGTKGDHNGGQIQGLEENIPSENIIGKAVGKIPLLGWIKLIFFEPFKSPDQQGFCS